MTTAYTSLLGLALPVQGELSGTWGDTVNNSITSLLDTSVAGTTNVSTDTDVTLTTTTGAANTARQAILLFSGSRTALRTVTAPAQSKIYTVINATTGGFAVKLVGSGPTTGLTIPNGASAVVAWNGSDFVEVGAGSIGNLVVNGTLTVTGATTLQSTLAVTGNITNTAGTANGVTYLNGSKVVTSGSALTFGGANLGVNCTATNFGANYRTFEVAAPQGAYILASDTTNTATCQMAAEASVGYLGMRTNHPLAFIVNNAEQMRLTSTGLGIGTSSPNISGVTKALTIDGTDAILEIANSGTVRATLYGNSSGAALSGVGSAGLRFFTSASGATSERMRLDSSGNLGIKCTPSTFNASGYGTVEFGSSGGSAIMGNANDTYFISNAYYNSAFYYKISAAAGNYNINNGVHKWSVAASGTAGNAITFTQAMTLDASGNLGIGTTSASGAKMDVSFSTTQSGIVCAPASNVYPGYSVLSTNGVIGTVKSGSGTIRLVDIRANELTALANGQVMGGYFEVNNANAAVNINGGQIALYGVANNISSLTTGHNYGVFGRNGGGGTNGYGVVAQLGAEQVFSGKAALIAATDDTANPIAIFRNGGGEQARFDSSGNLLVGTTSSVGGAGVTVGSTSSGKVVTVVASSYGNNGLFNAHGTDGNLKYQAGALGNTTAYVYANTSCNLDFYSNGSLSTRLDTSGRMLVGATSFTSYGTFNSYTNSTFPSGRFVGGPSTPDGNIVLMVDKYSSTNTTSQWFLGFTIGDTGTASGVITANGASQATFTSWSDRRLKENIVDLAPQLANIMALRPVEFDYIESEGGGHQISFIAQEFEEIYPDAIGARPDGMKTLSGWAKTEAILVKAIQEQQAIIESLKARLDAANL